MMTPVVNVVLLDLGKPKEAVTENADGSYTIFINPRLSADGQLKAYQHAMKHIESDDFRKENVQEIEAMAHENVTQYGHERIPAERYLLELERLRKRHRSLKRQIREDEKRIAFLKEHCNMYDRAENYYLYRNDL